MRTRTLLNPFSCNQRYTIQDWSEFFGYSPEYLDIEIGFGNGEFLERYAEQNITRSIVGFEIKHKLVEQVKQNIIQKKLLNCLAFKANGQYALEDMFKDGYIDKIFVFHPDPWPRRGHQKRRIISNTFLDIVYKKMKSCGRLYIATDVPELWDYIQTIIQNHNKFILEQTDCFWETEYKTRWKDLSIEQKRPLYFGTFIKC